MTATTSSTAEAAATRSSAVRGTIPTASSRRNWSGTDAVRINDASGADHLVAVTNGAGVEDVVPVFFERIGNDLVIAGGAVTVQSHYSGQAVEDIQFEGGASAFGQALGIGTYNLATSLSGGTGNDVIAGSSAAETLDGGAGNDLVFGAGGDDVLIGGADNDLLLVGGAGQDTVTGGAGNDTVVMLVTSGNVDVADGGADIDTLALSGVVPGTGVVAVNLALADQVVSIGGVADALVQQNFENLDASGLGSSVNATGSAGDNSITGSSGNDILSGGGGNDTFKGGAGDDLIDGGAGSDRLDYSDATAGINFTVNQGTNFGTFWSTGVLPGLGTDSYMNIEGVFGTNFADTLTGSGLNDILRGGGGNDSIFGGNGFDVIRGGEGNDTIDGGGGGDNISFSDSTTAGVGINFTLVRGSLDTVVDLTSIGLGTDTYRNIEGVIGTNFADTLTGSSVNDSLDGGGVTDTGDDTLFGGLGDDTLGQTKGNDSISGGSRLRHALVQ